LEDNGCCFSSVLNWQGTSVIDGETAVSSTSSYFNPVQSDGGVRVRVWARLDDVRKYLGPDSLVWVGGSKFEVACVDPRDTPIHIFVTLATDPGTSNGKSKIESVFYYLLDLIDFGGFHIPTGVIAAWANNFWIDTVTRDSFNVSDNTLEFSQGLYNEIPENLINLPSVIPYDNADAAVQQPSNSSGAEALFYFRWDLPDDQRSIQAVSSGKIRYQVCYPGSIPWSIWSGDAKENIVINKYQ
jgi:hypothetical protein